MLKYSILSILLCFVISVANAQTDNSKIPAGNDVRTQWISTMTKIAGPVIRNLAAGTLHYNMSYETNGNTAHRPVCYLEAAGRTICGIAPWLELGPDETEEGIIRKQYIALTVKAISNIVNPDSPDYCLFETYKRNRQPLVDAAFLAEGLLRAPSIYKQLDPKTRECLITEMKRTRNIQPFANNWVLFASMIEAFLLEVTGECDMERLLYGVDCFMKDGGWYLGDATYGDGNKFRADYYNSFIIHPMLTDVLEILYKHGMDTYGYYEKQLARQTRYAAIQERLISPEGTIPVIGRSMAYRFGCLHQLAQTTLMHRLPGNITPGQVRAAMTKVMQNIFSKSDVFDADDWLTVGFAGHQPAIGERYINTGSTYLTLTGFLPLGLPATDPFWTSPSSSWTSLQIWSGQNHPTDHAL